MSHRCSKNFWDRREFLFKSGGGISGLALAYLLNRDNLLMAAPASSDACAAPPVGEIAFLRSVYGRSNDHVQGTYEMQTGQINLGFPSVGSWVTYGLGSVATSLPAFVVMTDSRGGPLGGPNDWSAGFMPAAYQGTLFR